MPTPCPGRPRQSGPLLWQRGFHGLRPTKNSMPSASLRQTEESPQTAYAGVWAHASLLHCPRAVLPDVLARIHRALMPGGWHFASYKLGDGEGRDLLGRLHNFPSSEWLVAAYKAARFVVEAQEIYAGKASDGTQRDWIDLIVRKP